MFVDGLELMIALKHMLKVDRIRILAYILYAYGFPLLIVILSIILSNNEDHSNKKYVLIYFRKKDLIHRLHKRIFEGRCTIE